MDLRHNLPSAIYRTSVRNESGEIARDNKIAAAIEISIDRIFMALYCRRSFSPKSVSHVRLAIRTTRLLIEDIIKNTQLNPIEVNVLADLDELHTSILNDEVVQQILTSSAQIELLLNRINRDVSNETIPNLIKITRFVLTVANQIPYNDTNIVVPCIRILSANTPYAKSITCHQVIFQSERDTVINGNDFWYRIFKGLRFNSYNNDVSTILPNLCATINIGMIPDAGSGLGVIYFYFEEYLSSKARAQFIDQSNAFVYDFSIINNILTSNNTWMDKSFDLTNIGSLEAASDSVPEDDQSDSTDDGGVDTKTDSNIDNSITDTDNKTEDDTTIDGTNSSDDPNADIDTPDKSIDDGTNPDANTENDPLNSGLDNTDERKPLLLGLDLALPKNETLDEFMYKVSVARLIDNVIEFNHDELPLETVTTLTQWKSSLLFLTDAGETKRLLKTLNIKMK